jgi:hypothetical protein
MMEESQVWYFLISLAIGQPSDAPHRVPVSPLSAHSTPTASLRGDSKKCDHSSASNSKSVHSPDLQRTARTDALPAGVTLCER